MLGMKNIGFIAVILLNFIFINSVKIVSLYSQTNPTAQSLPYSQTFTGFAHNSTTYPAGWQGWKIANAFSTIYDLNSPLSDQSLEASANATDSDDGVYNFNEKIGFLSETGSYGLVLAVNTTGASNVVVQYDIMTIRNPYGTASSTVINGVELQYRVGTSGVFKSFNSRVYANNTTMQVNATTTPQNSKNFSVTLPDECDNQSVVQLRWAARNVVGVNRAPSIAIDNIDVRQNGVATQYYYKGTGSFSSTSSWGTNPNGTGSAPANFTANNQYFNVTTPSSISFSELWNITGTNSKVIVGNGTSAVTFTTTGSAQLNGVLDIESNSTYIIQQSTSNFPTVGTLYPNSTYDVRFTASFSNIPSETTFENLYLNSNGGHYYSFSIASANILVKKNFSVNNTNLDGSSAKFRMYVGGDFTMSSNAQFANQFPNNLNLTFNGTSLQTVRMNGIQLRVNTLTVTNPAGITLSTTGGSSDVNIAYGTTPALVMDGGNINLGTNLITLGASTSTTGTLTRNSGYLTGTGRLARWFSNSGLPTTLTNLFPMGNDTNNRGVFLSFSSASISQGGKLTVSHTHGVGPTAISPTFNDGGLIINKRSNMSWSIQYSDNINFGTTTVSLRLYGSGQEGVASIGDISLIRATTTAGGTFSAGTGTTTYPQVNRTAMTRDNLAGSGSPNIFYIGATNNSSLPVVLTSFTAITGKRNVSLRWSTSAEINNSGFEIERRNKSADDKPYSDWNKVSFVEGYGNTNLPQDYAFEDKMLNSGKYQYRIKQVDYNGNFEYFQLNSPSEILIGKPIDYDMSQNYPNPSNPVSKINFQLPLDGRVSIKVYDIIGKEVGLIFEGTKEAGYHTVEFNGSNLASGVYFYKIVAEDGNERFSKTMKMILVK